MSEKLDNFNEQRKEAFHSVLIPLSTFIIFFIVISRVILPDLPDRELNGTTASMKIALMQTHCLQIRLMMILILPGITILYLTIQNLPASTWVVPVCQTQTVHVMI